MNIMKSFITSHMLLGSPLLWQTHITENVERRYVHTWFHHTFDEKLKNPLISITPSKLITGVGAHL